MGDLENALPDFCLAQPGGEGGPKKIFRRVSTACEPLQAYTFLHAIPELRAQRAEARFALAIAIWHGAMQPDSALTTFLATSSLATTCRTRSVQKSFRKQLLRQVGPHAVIRT